MSEPKTPASQETKPVREIDEQTQKHIDRFLQGKEVWNKWANEMLARKEKLKQADKWKVREGFDTQGRYRAMSADTSTPEIQAWLDEAYVDFSNLIFQTEQSSDLQDVGEDKVKEKQSLVKSISVSGDEINFTNFIFPSYANFRSAKFRGGANFGSAEFHGEAYFISAEFHWDADFGSAEFHGGANFISAEFQGEAYFISAKFRGGANFGSAEFHWDADFRSAKFRGEANFGLVDFERHANFSKTKFNKAANFEAILVKRAFSLADAEFKSRIPNYTQANFAESPRLDHIEVLPAPSYEDYPFPSKKIQSSLKWQRYWWNLQYRAYLMRLFWRCVYKLTPSNYRKLYHKGEILKYIWSKFRNTRRDKNEEAHYRALKRLAIQAHDHENEMKFFAGEIRARRHITDFANFLTHDFASSMRYWSGVAYEAFSDFGRSFIRPALWWFACLWLFANLTLSNAGLEDTTKCHNSQLTPKEAAYTIGLKNSLLILGLTKTNIVKQAELCLYGLNKNGANKNGEANSKPKTYDPKIKRAYIKKSNEDKQRLADTTKTDIPFKAAVQGIIHSGLSLLFIFLLLLAIRNQFKIK
jgi:uncharacterized protein YjbI with pentapeptide repeats